MTYQKSWTDLAGSPLNRANDFIISALHPPSADEQGTQLTDQEWLDQAARELELNNIRTDVISHALDRISRPANVNFHSTHGAPTAWAQEQIVRWKQNKRPALAIPAPHTTLVTASICRLALALSLCALGTSIFAQTGTMGLPLVIAICLWTTLAPISHQLVDYAARRTLAIRTHLTVQISAAAAALGTALWSHTANNTPMVEPAYLWATTALSWLTYVALAVANSRRWRTANPRLTDRLWMIQATLGLQTYVTGGHLADARRELATFMHATRPTSAEPNETHLESYGPVEDIISLYLQGSYQRLSRSSESRAQTIRRNFWGRFVAALATITMCGVLLSLSRVAPEQSIVAGVGFLGSAYRAAWLLQQRRNEDGA